MHYHGIALTFLLCIVLKCSAQYYYEIRGGPVSDANTIFICVKDECVSANGKYTLAFTFRVNSSGNTEKAWYIKTKPVVAGESIRNVYATLELWGTDGGSWNTKEWKHFEYTDGSQTQTAVKADTPSYVLKEVPSLLVYRRSFVCTTVESGGAADAFSSAVGFNNEVKKWLVNGHSGVSAGDDDDATQCAQDAIERFSLRFQASGLLDTGVGDDGGALSSAAGTHIHWVYRWFACEMQYNLPARTSAAGDTWRTAKHCFESLLVDLTVSVPNPSEVPGIGQWVLDHQLLLQYVATSDAGADARDLGEILALLRVRYSTLLVLHELRFDSVVELLQGSAGMDVTSSSSSAAPSSALGLSRALLQFALHMLHDPRRISVAGSPTIAAVMVRSICDVMDGLIPVEVEAPASWVASRRLHPSVRVTLTHSCQAQALLRAPPLVAGTVNSAGARTGDYSDVGGATNSLASDADDRAHTSSLLLHLLTQGATDPAAVLVRNHLYLHLCSASSDFKWCDLYHGGANVEEARVQIYSVFSYFHPALKGSVDTLWESPPPASVGVFLRDGGLVAMYLSSLLQLTSPTLVSHVHTLYSSSSSNHTQPSSSQADSVVAQDYSLCVRALESLVHICEALQGTSAGGCKVSDPVTLVNGRGLFLLAYQGVSLADPEPSGGRGVGSQSEPTVRAADWKIPSLYYELVRLSTPGLAKHAAEYQCHQLAPASTDLPVESTTRPPLKVAFLSAFWFRHSVGKLLGKVVSGLSEWSASGTQRALRVELVHITDKSSKTNDDLTVRLQTAVSATHVISPHRGLEGTAAELRALQFDILVFGDVFMDSFTLHLAMFRLAPVQVAFWGHPFTSGFPSIDYFISSSLYENAPRGGGVALNSRYDQFTEQLVLFDSLTFAFSGDQPPVGTSATAAAPAPALSDDIGAGPVLELHVYLLEHGVSVDFTPFQLPVVPPGHGGFVFYGVLQSAMKMHPGFDLVLAQILVRDPTAVMVLQFNSKQAVLFDKWRERLRVAVVGEYDRLSDTRSGFNITAVGPLEGLLERLVFIRQVPAALYSRLVCLMDVNLDPFPFGGGVTLMESCLCDVPFLTLPFKQTVHQLGAGIVSKMAHPDNGSLGQRMVAHSQEEFVANAVVLAAASHHKKASPSSAPWMKCRDGTFMSQLDDEAITEWSEFLQRIAWQHW